MGMVLALRRFSAAEAADLRADPSDILWILSGMEEPSLQPGCLAALFGRSQPPAEQREWQEPPASHEIDLDKAWHAIHFMLAGQAWEGEGPSAFLMVGGTRLGEVEVGYDVPRMLDADEVTAFSEVLGPIDEAELRSRYDLKAFELADIYPNIWDSPDDEFPYVFERFEALKSFVSAAAQEGDSLVITII